MVLGAHGIYLHHYISPSWCDPQCFILTIIWIQIIQSFGFWTPPQKMEVVLIPGNLGWNNNPLKKVKAFPWTLEKKTSLVIGLARNWRDSRGANWAKPHGRVNWKICIFLHVFFVSRNDSFVEFESGLRRFCVYCLLFSLGRKWGWGCGGWSDF